MGNNMSNKSINFIGKNTLIDAEFLQYYEQLWEKTPHKNNWLLKEKNAERKREGAKRYNAEETTLPGEEWRELPNCNKYSISNMGRVKYEDKIVQQDDAGKTGYPKLDVDKKLNVDHTVNVYTLVAKAFLGKKEGDGYDVHHKVRRRISSTPLPQSCSCSSPSALRLVPNHREFLYLC